MPPHSSNTAIASLELEQQVALYQFYLSAYLKGIAFYLAISGALGKFAADSESYRSELVWLGVLSSLAALIPLTYGFVHERYFRASFVRLADATATTPISTGPFRMLIAATTTLWAIVTFGWLFIWRWL